MIKYQVTYRNKWKTKQKVEYLSCDCDSKKTNLKRKYQRKYTNVTLEKLW